ncbi:6374_t:CDS:2, partial [Entrophospora sp. SA101]
NNTTTQQDMINFLTQQTGLTIHQSNISRLLKREGITYKKLTYHYTQLDEEKAKAFNEEIKPLLAEYPFIALDECSFYPKLDPRFGYSLKGSRAIAKRPGHKGKHYTLLFAIKINPIGNQKNYLLLDNAKIHKAPKKRIKAKLPSIGEQLAEKNIEARFITAYAPMLNPTELVFCLLRQQTEKQRPRNYEELKNAIEGVVEMLNQKDLRKFFAQNNEKERISALEVAKYLLSLDPKRKYFILERMKGEEDMPRKGDFRLNKMLHMCQIFHCAKYGKPLFEEKLEAFRHGAVIHKVHENFKEFYNSLQEPIIDLTSEKKDFIEKIYCYFKEFDDLTLRDFSHDDPA